MRLLITRPDPDAERTAGALRARGHEVLVQPLLRIEPITDADLVGGPWSGVAITSANAIEAVAQHPAKASLLALSAFTVGSRTREAALGAGFMEVLSADGDVTDLARLIASRCVPRDKPLIYLAGEDRAGDLEGRLKAAGIAVRTAIVYRAVAARRLAPEIEQALTTGALDAVLHYSKRTAEAFVAAASTAGLWPRARGLRHFCLSAAVAAPLVAAGAQHILVAARPEQNALFELLNQA